jgi:hypothetical protein
MFERCLQSDLPWVRQPTCAGTNLQLEAVKRGQVQSPPVLRPVQYLLAQLSPRNAKPQINSSGGEGYSVRTPERRVRDSGWTHGLGAEWPEKVLFSLLFAHHLSISPDGIALRAQQGGDRRRR